MFGLGSDGDRTALAAAAAAAARPGVGLFYLRPPAAAAQARSLPAEDILAEVVAAVLSKRMGVGLRAGGDANPVQP